MQTDLSFQRHLDFITDSLDLKLCTFLDEKNTGISNNFRVIVDWTFDVLSVDECPVHQNHSFLYWNRSQQATSCTRVERVIYADWVPAISDQGTGNPGGLATERHFAPATVLLRTRQVRPCSTNGRGLLWCHLEPNCCLWSWFRFRS